MAVLKIITEVHVDWCRAKWTTAGTLAPRHCSRKRFVLTDAVVADRGLTKYSYGYSVMRRREVFFDGTRGRPPWMFALASVIVRPFVVRLPFCFATFVLCSCLWRLPSTRRSLQTWKGSWAYAGTAKETGSLRRRATGPLLTPEHTSAPTPRTAPSKPQSRPQTRWCVPYVYTRCCVPWHCYSIVQFYCLYIFCLCVFFTVNHWFQPSTWSTHNKQQCRCQCQVSVSVLILHQLCDTERDISRLQY